MSQHRDANSWREEAPAPALERSRDALDRISSALRGLRYGTVTAVVQDGVVVQVERTERIRLDRRAGRVPT
jgi:hypothetical protein